MEWRTGVGTKGRKKGVSVRGGVGWCSGWGGQCEEWGCEGWSGVGLRV